MLRPGEALYSQNQRHSARVRADGTLIGNDAVIEEVEAVDD